MCCLYIILNIVLFCFIYYVPWFSSFHSLQLWFFIPCHHLPTYYTDSKGNTLYMSVMSFFMSRNRVFLLDPYLHFLFTLVSFQSCLFSFVLLLLVFFALFIYCFNTVLLCFIYYIPFLSSSHSFQLCLFFPAITYEHIILCISSFELCVVYLFHCFPSLLFLISFVMSFLLFLPSFSCILCLFHGF